ncbi:aminopeptidase, partial [Diaphorobacter sp.]|uniref:aminopeptidase n=1 Tax=Diaphorobacter sp. TaxID=1934310 RepID=UPI002899FA77
MSTSTPSPRRPWPLLAAALLLGGCAQSGGTLGYYWQSLRGHLEIMNAARPVQEWITHPDTSAPLRERLHATLTPARIEALTLLPVFTTRYNTWSDPERNGWWEGDVWIGARQPGQQGGHSWGRALKFSWRNGSERAGDPEDDAHACYQIDLTPSDALPEGTAHPNGLRISYSQRQSDPRTPLPNHAVQHMQHLLELFTTLEQRLHAAHAQEQQALHTSGLSGDAPPLPRLP